MLLKKKSLTLLSIVFTISCFSQMKSMDIVFNDGSKVEGIGIIHNDQVRFKHMDSLSVSTKYELADIDYLRISNSTVDYGIYKYIKIDDRRKSMILEELLKGEVSLYRRVKKQKKSSLLGNLSFVSNYSNGIAAIAATIMSTVSHPAYNEWSKDRFTVNSIYLKKTKEVEVTTLYSRGTSLKKVKKILMDYFSDCKELQELIQEKEFHTKKLKSDITDIIKFYNEKCH